MSVTDAIHAIEDKARAVVDDIASIDREAISAYEAIKATPEGGEVLGILGRVIQGEASAVFPAGTLATFLGILKGVEALANVVPQPAQPVEQPPAA